MINMYVEDADEEAGFHITSTTARNADDAKRIYPEMRHALSFRFSP